MWLYVEDTMLRQGCTGLEVERLQEQLGVEPDGLFGPKTKSAVIAFQRDAGLTPDGIVGELTQAALDAQEPAQEDQRGRDVVIGTVSPAFPASLRSRKDLYRLLGTPGDTGSPWAKENIVYCHPRGHKAPLPGVPEKWWVAIHKEVEPYLREALRRAQGTYSIERLGGFVYRHQRHDPERPLSDHSWGVAIDVNPKDNRMLKTKAKPWSEEWMRLWPRGVTPEFVEAFESVGWKWGGRWKGVKDNMHFSLCG